MANSDVAFRYFWVKVVDQDGQIKEDAQRLHRGPGLDLSSPAFVHVIIFADKAPPITINTVQGGFVQRPGTSNPPKVDTIALGTQFSEQDALQWIETEDGQEWKGHAQVCVLHRVAVHPEKLLEQKKAKAKLAKASPPA